MGRLADHRIYSRQMGKPWSEFLDDGTQQLGLPGQKEPVLSIHNQGELRRQRLNYWKDPQFYELVDPCEEAAL